MKNTQPDDLSIIFNITGKRDEHPILNLLAELNPSHIFLTPNVSTTSSSIADQDNRNNPLSVVSEKLGNHKAHLNGSYKMNNLSVSCLS